MHPQRPKCAASRPWRNCDAWQYARLPRLFGIILLQPTANGGRAIAHALAYMLNTESLFFNHFDDFQLEAGIEIAALPCHANLLGWWDCPPIEVSGQIRPLHQGLDQSRRIGAAAAQNTQCFHAVSFASVAKTAERIKARASAFLAATNSWAKKCRPSRIGVNATIAQAAR